MSLCGTPAAGFIDQCTYGRFSIVFEDKSLESTLNNAGFMLSRPFFTMDSCVSFTKNILAL